MASPVSTSGPSGGPGEHGVRLSPSPICLIDLGRDLVCSTSSPWSDVGLAAPRDGRLSAALHPDDAERVLRFLEQAPTVPQSSPAVTVARFRTADGWRETRIAALRVDGLLEDAEVMMRLS